MLEGILDLLRPTLAPGLIQLQVEGYVGRTGREHLSCKASDLVQRRKLGGGGWGGSCLRSHRQQQQQAREQSLGLLADRLYSLHSGDEGIETE